MHICVCKTCSKQFETHKKSKQYCTHKCYASRFGDVTKSCESCNESFTVAYRFRGQKTCNASCSGKLASSRAKQNRVAKKCLSCEKEYDVTQSYAGESKYCSHDCFYRHKYDRDSVIVTLTCEGCKRQFERKFIQRMRRFCSKSCANSGDNNCSRAPSVAKKMSETKRLNYALGFVHPWTGRKHTEASRKLIRVKRLENPLVGEKNGMWGKRHSEKTKEAMSDAKTLLILSGKFKPYTIGSKKGHYTSTRTQKTYFYRSSWEYAFMVWLDNNVNVKSWDYECVRIPYYYDDHKRWYVPDFVVVYVDDPRPTMYEIKPFELLDTEKVMLKRDAATIWCQENSYKENVTLTRKSLIEMGVDLKIRPLLEEAVLTPEPEASCQFFA